MSDNGESSDEEVHPPDLIGRLIRHGEHLRTVLAAREQDDTGQPLPYDEELHSAAYRLLTTIDLLTSDRGD